MPRPKRKRPHGLGCVYQRGLGNWWIKWREGGRVRYAHGYATCELAEQVRNKIVADVAAGRAGLPPDPSGIPTLAELAPDWLERRKTTHRAAKDDAIRWNRHLKAHFGTCRPADVDAAGIRRFVEKKLKARPRPMKSKSKSKMTTKPLNPATVGHCVRLLSTFFTDIVERGLCSVNPVRALPRATRRLYRPTADPRNTPFLETTDDLRRVFLELPEPINVAFAIGALAGLRTAEVLGLDWNDVDLRKRRMHVRRQMQDGQLVTLKDGESRDVPILTSLAPILAACRLKSGSVGPLFPAGWHGLRGGTSKTKPKFIRPHTLHKYLKQALERLRKRDAQARRPGTLPTLTWYQCTRHTFASQWVLAGGSIEKLAMMMGHSSTVVTQRYAHVRPELFRDSDYSVIDVDLEPKGEIVSLDTPAAETGAFGYAVVTQANSAESQVAVNI